MNCIQQQVPATRSRVCIFRALRSPLFHTLVCMKAIDEAYATWFRFPNWIYFFFFFFLFSHTQTIIIHYIYNSLQVTVIVYKKINK